MNTSVASDHINDYRWNTIFATLSLDMAFPFVAQMGLTLPPDRSFLEGLRDVVKKFRQMESSHDALPATSFSQAAFEWAANEFGPGFANHLYAWGENVFQTGEKGAIDAFIWENIIKRGGLDGTRDLRRPPDFVQVLRENLARRTKDPVNRIAPTSAWDRTVYERQQYDKFRNPMELVQATIRYYDFASSWQETIRLAGQPDLRQLKEWGTQEALLLGIPLERIGEPGNWPPLPPPWI